MFSIPARSKVFLLGIYEGSIPQLLWKRVICKILKGSVLRRLRFAHVTIKKQTCHSNNNNNNNNDNNNNYNNDNNDKNNDNDDDGGGSNNNSNNNNIIFLVLSLLTP